jgi:hypothetical protein
MATSDLAWFNDLYNLPVSRNMGYGGAAGGAGGAYGAGSMAGAQALNMPVTRPNYNNWTIDDYRNAGVGGNRSGYSAVVSAVPTGGNSRAAYEQRLNSNGSMPAAGSRSYNNYGPNNYSNGVNSMVGQIGAGMNMTGGGTNLYGGSGNAVVPMNGVIYNGGGGGGGYAFSPMTYGQKYGSGGGGQQQMGLGQQLASEVQRAHNEGRAANEKRYNDVLNGDQTGAQNAMAEWFKKKYPNMADDRLQKLMQNPAYLAKYNKENPGAAASFGGYRDRYSRNMSYLDGQGVQQKKDIDSDYAKLNANQQQNLAARGLMNSTISQTMQNATERKRQDSLGTLNESLNRQRLAADSQLSGDVLGVQERRQDSYPDMMQYAQLMMQLGNSGMVGGGYNGGYGGGQQTGVGTMLGGTPMVYGGNRASSSYGAGNVRGLNATSGTTRW